ncbi:MAG: hypothetical protein M3336_14300, partial [Chloroflexota bacterium]|nr:hypothetical protein [Chloroflexota bacterium]
LEAYDRYLRGNALTTRPKWFVPQARRDAVRMYEVAVARDPAFAAAWARLALAHGRLYQYSDDRRPERLALARAAALRAFALDSTLPEASLARARFADDRDRTIERYAIALRAHPNSADLLFAMGEEQRRLGRLEEALTSVARAAALDPLSPNGPAEMANIYDVRRDYAAAVREREREIELTPDNATAYVAQALSYVNWRGDTAAAARMLGRAAAPGPARLVQVLASPGGLLASRVLWPALDAETRRFLDTARVTAALGAPWNVHRLKAEHFERSGRPTVARAHYDSARTLLEERLRRQPADAELHGALGLAYAALGRRNDALREGRLCVELRRPSQYAGDSLTFTFTHAMIAARVGAADVVVAQLVAGLPTYPSVSPYWLRLDPVWDPIRGDPRFQRLARGRS